MYTNRKSDNTSRLVAAILAIVLIATSCDFSYALAPESKFAQKGGMLADTAGELYAHKLVLSTIGRGLYANLSEDGFRQALRRLFKKDGGNALNPIIKRKDQNGLYFTLSGTHYRAFLIEKDSKPPEGAEPKSLKDGRIFWVEKAPGKAPTDMTMPARLSTLDNSTLFIYHPYYKGEAVGEEVSLDPILKHFFEKNKNLTVVLLRRHKDPGEKSVKREPLELKNSNRLITVTAQGDHRQFNDPGLVRREIEDCFNQSGSRPMRVCMNAWRDASGRAAVETCMELSRVSGRYIPVKIWVRADDLGKPEDAANNENVKTLKMATEVAAISEHIGRRLAEVGVTNVFKETLYSIADVVERRTDPEYDARVMADGAVLASQWEREKGVKRAVFIPGSPARPKKNVYQALDWIERADKKIKNGKTSIFIATPDLDEESRQRLISYAEEKNLDIHPLGQLSPYEVVVCAAAVGRTGCVLIPSKNEPLGRVPAEVSGFAPVLVSDVGGLRETIGTPGMVLSLTDDAKAVDTLTRLLTDAQWRDVVRVAQGDYFKIRFGHFTWDAHERFLTSQPTLVPPVPPQSTIAAGDRFAPTKNITVPKGYHPDLRPVQRRGMNDLLVPIRPDQIFDTKELLETGTFNAPYQKRIVVPGDDEMTHVSGEVLTGIMAAAEFKFTIGLATGGTTESLRKLMGLADMVRSQYGDYIDGDKIKKICTLDNYYFMDYLKRQGLGEEDASKVIAISSYESEQLYMMIRNMMGGDVKSGFFVAPPGFTGKRWFESADDFRRLLFKFFCVAEFAQLWQLHGIGTNSHDAFNEIYRRFRREMDDTALQLYRTGEVKRARLADGTDLAKLGLRAIPEFTRIPSAFSSMGMFRDDHPTLISFIIQVQNSGHFIPRKFHPFFLKTMGDNSLYDLEDLFAWILASTPEGLLNYTGEKKYHFKDMQEFVGELNYLLEQFGNVPLEATTQGTLATLTRGSVPLPDGSFPMQLFMCSAAHKQLALVRALNPSPGLSTAAVVLNLAKNALLVATSESLGKVTDSWTMDTFIKVAPDATGLQEKVEERWLGTKEGERISALLETHSEKPKPSPDMAVLVEKTENTIELNGTVISNGAATGSVWKAGADTFESLKERAGKARAGLTMNDVDKAIKDVIGDLGETKWAEELANTIKISALGAGAENHKIIIGLQTDEWVPGEQAADIQALERAVKQFTDTMKRRGVVQNVSVVLGNSKTLAANVAAEKPANGDKVIMIGNEKTLAADEFKAFKDAYFAYVDLSKLNALDYISLIEMIDMAVHFAVDNAAASASGIQVETLGERIVRFTPSRRLDVEEPSKIYKLQISELAKQA